MRSTNRSRRGRGGLFDGTGLIVAGLTATLIALVFPIWSYADRSGTGVGVLNASTVMTRYGPLSGLDREFVTKVRLAGLWELPAGQQAQTKGTTEAVRTAGNHLIEGHTFLDARVRDVAARLALPLPNQPADQQKTWLDTLTAAQGEQYDREFANLLRLAHGKVFSVVAQVRATTRNSLVRGLADDANTTVLDHIRVLEATGLVDYDAIARDAASASAPPITNSPAPPAGLDDPGSPIPVTPSPVPSPATSSPRYTLPPAANGPEGDGD
jgi:predicted outer membrane protein